MKSNSIALVLICFFLSFCKFNKEEWQTLDFGSFHLKTPPGWKKIIEHGTDSYAGGLTNGKDSLEFDLGIYGETLEEDRKQYIYKKTTGKGLYGEFTCPKITGHGFFVLRVPYLGKGSQFTIWGKDIQDTATIKNIYRSIVFKNHNPDNDSTIDLDHMTILPERTGKTIFDENCASCHSIYKIIIGPPFEKILKYRSASWIYYFIKDSNSVKKDTIHREFCKNYNSNGTTCLEFPSLSKNDIDLIVEYFNNQLNKRQY